MLPEPSQQPDHRSAIVRFAGVAGRRLRGSWQWTRDRWRVVLIIRFSVLIPLFLAAALFGSDQMQDILVDFVERGALLPLSALLFMSFVAGLATWYSARTMLRYRFLNMAASDPARYPSLKKYLPRLLGLAVPGVFALRYVLLAQRDTFAFRALMMMALALAGVAALLLLYMAGRHRLAERPSLRALADPPGPRFDGLWRWRQTPAVTRRIFWSAIIANIVFLVLFVSGSRNWTDPAGAPAILLLGLALMAATGSWIVYYGNRYGVPMLAVVLGAGVVFSPWNDNHVIRYQPGAGSAAFLHRAVRPVTPAGMGKDDAPESMRQYFERWWSTLLEQSPGSGPAPVVVVSAEGGGVRAAYWTASVLARLEELSAADAQPFSRHVFAVSGVSGGSVGAAMFAATVQEHLGEPASTDRRKELDQVLGADFLTPTLSQALFPDLLQRLFPVPVFNDRAIALEESWERAWSHAHPQGAKNPLATPFGSLWAGGENRVPLLFFNSTVVESGERAVLAPVSVAGDTFAYALPLSSLIGTGMPLSTAAHTSARFTYVSPAALVDTGRAGDARWIRLVDGGYFDNSGMATAAEIVHALEVFRDHPPAGGDAAVVSSMQRMRILVLHLPNEAVGGERAEGSATGRAFLEETLSPVRAVVNARVARGLQAVSAMRKLVDAADSRLAVVSVAPCKLDAPLPLGWVLSRRVREGLGAQLENCGTLSQYCPAKRLEAVHRWLVKPEGPVLDSSDRVDPYEWRSGC